MLKKYIHYVSLNIVSMIGLSFYIIVDTYFISKGMGSKGLTALNLAIPLFNFITAIGMLCGIGGCVLFNLYINQDKEKDAHQIFTTSLLFGITIALLLELCGFLFTKDITYLLGANKDSYDMTYIYIRVMLLFSPFLLSII